MRCAQHLIWRPPLDGLCEVGMSLQCGGLCWEAALSPSHSNHADIIPGMDTNEIMKGLDAEIARIQQAKTILGGQEVRNGRTVAAELSCDIEF